MNTAHHEAAHSVMTYRVTGCAEDVSIVPRGDTLGRTSGGLNDTRAPKDMEGQILSLYAGGHAQREVYSGEGDDGCWDDDDQAAELLSRWGWEDREQELRDRSLSLVRQYWVQIAAVAAQLLADGALEATEVELIAEREVGDPDADLDCYRQLAGEELRRWRHQMTKEEEDARWSTCTVFIPTTRTSTPPSATPSRRLMRKVRAS